MKELRPLVVTVSFKVLVDMNELLEDFSTNTNIGEIRKNVGMFLRDEINKETMNPGDEFSVPGFDEIVANLQEWDFVTSK